MLTTKPYTMKQFIIFLFAVLVSFSGCKEQKLPERTHMDFFTPYNEYHNGKLKSVKEENFWAVEKDGQIEKGRLVTDKDREDSSAWTGDFEAFYNEDGIVIRVDYFNDARSIEDFWVTTIENNKITRADWTEKDTAQLYSKISYDDQGNIKESKRYRTINDTLLNTYTYKTDENGNIIETVAQNHLGEMTYKYILQINQEGLVTEQKDLVKGDSLTYLRRNTYNDKGFIITDDIYDGEENLTDSYRLEYTDYNDNGSWLKVIYYRKDKPFIITERTYTYY